LAYPGSFLHGLAPTTQPLDENTWELYNLNDDPTERIDLAKKYPEKLTQLKAEFEEQAKAHHLAPYLTFDDMKNTHHTYLPQWYIDRQNAAAAAAQAGSSK